MKERRPLYVRWKGNWYSGEVVRCGPAYVYKVKSVVNRDIYLLERLNVKTLDDDSYNEDDILSPGTDVKYYNQQTGQWERGVIIIHDDCGYAQVRWKMPGMYEEFVDWFDASNVSTTPPNVPHSRKLLKPGLFGAQENFSNNEDDENIVENNALMQHGYRKRSQNSAKPKLFARLRSKQPPPRLPPDNTPQESDTDQQSEMIEEITVEHIDSHSNPLSPKFNGIPPKWLAPTPVFYPCPMYVPVPVLIPHYPPRPPSITYPFFPGQMMDQNFNKVHNSKGIPPHKGAFRLSRIVPKHQSKLMTRQPFSFSGRKLSRYEPKSLEVERKIEYLPPYESIVRSKFQMTRKTTKDKRYAKLSSTSDSSEEDEVSLYSRRPASADSAKSKDQTKPFRPGSANSGKIRTRASSDLTRSFITEKKLSDLPSSSPTIKEPDISITELSSKQVAVTHDGTTQNSDIIRDEDDVITDGQVAVMSSDSGVRTDTAAYSTSNQQHGNCSEDDQSSATVAINDNPASTGVSVPSIVIENSSRRLNDTSDSEVFTSEIRVHPSHASIEQYLLGSEQLSDAEHGPSREHKSSGGSATELHLNTVPSTSSLSHSVDVFGDITTCRSKRRLLYSASSEPETKPGSSDSSSNDDTDLSHRSPEKQKFTTVLPTAVELPEESIPGTPNTKNSLNSDNSPPQSPVASSNTRMSSFLRTLSPVRLMSLRPKKKVTFTT